MTKTEHPPKRLTREETRQKLKRFLKEGDGEDVASVLVHSLMHRADTMAGVQEDASEHLDDEQN